MCEKDAIDIYDFIKKLTPDMSMKGDDVKKILQAAMKANPWCENCLEDDCEISIDGDCRQIRIYRKGRGE